MDVYLKSTAGVLIAVVMYLILSKQGQGITVLLTVSVCCLLSVAVMQYIEPVITFMRHLQQISKLDSGMLQIILRVIGISLLTEITMLICSDAGNAAMGKTLQILACAAILWISIPLLTEFIRLIEEILLVL